MTLKTFWRLARERSWRVEAGAVACRRGYCPLGAVIEDVLNPYVSYLRPPPDSAADRLGLNPKFARRLAAAADSRRSKYHGWLLKNLGVRP